MNKAILALVLCSMAAHAQAPFVAKPTETPATWATPNHQLIFSVPTGYYCPLPPDWVGSDHGRRIYLVAPASCDSEPEWDDPIAVPWMSWYYGYNVAEMETADGDSRPPITDAEAVALDGFCEHNAIRLFPDMRIFGRAATGCVTRDDATVKVEVVALYRAEPGEDEPPNHKLDLTLRTTPERFGEDYAAFRALAGSVRVCARDDGDTRVACPVGKWW